LSSSVVAEVDFPEPATRPDCDAEVYSAEVYSAEVDSAEEYSAEECCAEACSAGYAGTDSAERGSPGTASGITAVWQSHVDLSEEGLATAVAVPPMAELALVEDGSLAEVLPPAPPPPHALAAEGPPEDVPPPWELDAEGPPALRQDAGQRNKRRR
jgi:hypothetical protein